MPFQQICMVINKRAGTYLSSDPERLHETWNQLFEAHHVDADIYLCQPQELEQQLEEVLQKKYDAVFIGGGDGTINHAIPLLLQHQVPVGVMPLGTMNMLARDLNIPLDPKDALAALLQGQPQRIDIMQLNQHYFLNRATLGFYSKVLREWGETRGRTRLMRGLFFLRYFLRRLWHARRLKLRLEMPDHSPRVVKSKVMAVSNNPYYVQGSGLLPARKSLCQGCMGVYISSHRTFWSVLRLLGLGLFKRWEYDQELEILQTSRVSIYPHRHRKIPISLDGEVVDIQPPYHFKIHPLALSFVYPITHPQLHEENPPQQTE